MLTDNTRYTHWALQNDVRQPTSKQREQQATALDCLLQGAKNVDTSQLYDAIVALLQARQDVSPAKLEAMAMRLSRWADDLERQSR